MHKRVDDEEVDEKFSFDDFCNFEDSFNENDFAPDSAFNKGLFDTKVLKSVTYNNKPPPSRKEVRLPFEKSNIIHGNPVYIRKKLSYTAHASTVYSVDQALAIVDYIGKKTWSEHSLPYAISIVENGQPLAVVEDGGEFACGNIELTIT